MNEPMDTESTDNDPIVEKAKAHFENSVDSLDAATLSRLNQGRHRALAELERASFANPRLRWVPATGIAAIALLVVIVMRGQDGIDAVEGPATAADFEMLLEEDSLDMLEELEFYFWLEASDLEVNDSVG